MKNAVSVWIPRCLIVSQLFVAATLHAEPPGTDTTGSLDQVKRVPLDIARQRAELMHNIYAATLDVMHHRYFRNSRATVPARALEDVFAEITREAHIEARWISVNTEPMSIKHKPESDFEKQAVAAIRSGKSAYEAVDGGTFRRAGAIALASSCLGCHGKSFGLVSKKTPRSSQVTRSGPARWWTMPRR